MERATEVEMVEAVKAHALKNYEKGWDTVIECYDYNDIVEMIGKARTCRGAIRLAAAFIKPYNDYAAEIRATAF